VTDIFPTPNIDAAGGGFGSLCRPLVTGGDPQAILRYAGQLDTKVRALVGILGDLERSRDQLRQAWPSGTGSDAAVRKLTRAMDVFNRLLHAVTAFIKQLEATAGQLDTATKGCNAAIRSAEPTVAALRSNPYTQAAATAMATGTTSSVAGFLKAIGSLLTSIGQGNIGSLVSSVGTMAGEVAQLSGGAAAAPTTATPTTTTPSTTPTATTATPATPITMPATPNLGSLTAATPSTAQPTMPATTPATTPAGTGFVPVAPGTNTAGGAVGTTTVPANAAGTGHHVTVTVNDDGSVVVDADISAQVDVVERNADGSEVDKHITVAADGAVTAS
jgi:uncharacterized protein YukE